MRDVVISAEKISKSYSIHHQLQRNAHPTLRDDIVRMARKPLQLIGAAGGTEKEKFWALRNIGFEVERGDVVGIMGRNGSGKSTLFKILSRVTQPTSGQVEIKGQSASLLEVGTGFHPELTGRENVYFNGSILGMKKKQIEQRFDEIVAFAEVEKFLDTPVKFYSSGMKVRLAFSVAAFLDPEILIIDEVLAVGDVRFKQKSLDRMKSIASNEGKTILFVSHIVNQIEAICTRGIVLESGRMVHDGALDVAVDTYLDLNQASVDNEDAVMSGKEDFTSGEIKLENIQTSTTIKKGLPRIDLELKLSNKTNSQIDNLLINFLIEDRLGKNLAIVTGEDAKKILSIPATSKLELKASIKDINLIPDDYSLSMGLRDASDPRKIYLKSYSAAKVRVPDYEFMNRKLVKPRDSVPPVVLDFEIN